MTSDPRSKLPLSSGALAPAPAEPDHALSRQTARSHLEKMSHWRADDVEKSHLQSAVEAPLDGRIGSVVRRCAGAAARRDRLAPGHDGGGDRVHARQERRHARQLRRIGDPASLRSAEDREPDQDAGLSAPAASSQFRAGRELLQARKPHDGLRCELLSKFHAALVGGMICFIEIDVGQLLRAAQRTAFDLLDFPRCPRRRRLGRSGVRDGRGRGGVSKVMSCSRWAGPNLCDHAIMSLSRRLSSSAVDPGSSLPSSRCFLRSVPPFGPPCQPALAAQPLPSDSASFARSSAVRRTPGSSASAMT